MFYRTKGHVFPVKGQLLHYKKACIIKNFIFYFSAITFNNLHKMLVNRVL